MGGATLDDVMRFEFQELMWSYQTQYAVSDATVREIFIDLKRWLWLAGTVSDVNPVMLEGMWPIDDMWHMFITYTIEYADFCDAMFGKFLNHVPVRHQEKEALRLSLAQGDDEARRARDSSLDPWREAVKELLGRDIEERWLHEYPAMYPPSVRFQLAVAALSSQFITAQTSASKPRSTEAHLLFAPEHIPRCDLMPNCGPGCSGICLSGPRPRP